MARRARTHPIGVLLIAADKRLRRRFVKIVRDGAAPAAMEALRRIGQIYTVERALRGRSAEERRAGRQLLSLPLVTALKAWFDERLKILSGKSLTAEVTPLHMPQRGCQ